MDKTEKKRFTFRLDEETYLEIEKIMTARRWGQQVMGEVIVEHYLKSVKAAAKQAKQVQNDGK